MSPGLVASAVANAGFRVDVVLTSAGGWDMKRRRIGLVVVFLLLLLFPGVVVSGQEAQESNEVVQHHPEGDAAIGKLKSPFCPGLMLEVCSHPDSKVLRDTLQVMAEAGVSSDSLVTWMLASYGEQYRAVPQARGTGLLAWLMPPLVLLGGVLFVVLGLIHVRKRRPVDPQPADPLSEDEESVLEEALQEMKTAEEVPF
jgi:cytochrome c-type biogenesis protein CcmH/NrfF